MIQVLLVPGPLPGLNDFGHRGSHWVYNNLKKQWGQEVSVAITKCKLKPMQYAVLQCRWHEPDTKRDPDNITVGLKFVLDALVHRKILPGDGWAHVLSIAHEFAVDAGYPRLELVMRTK